MCASLPAVSGSPPRQAALSTRAPCQRAGTTPGPRGRYGPTTMKTVGFGRRGQGDRRPHRAHPRQGQPAGRASQWRWSNWFDQSKALADEAKALADEAIRAAKLLQAPTPEQVAAAKEAYKAALAMRQMAREHAEKAGLDPATMKAKKTEGGERRARGPKKPAPTEKPGGPGGEMGSHP